MCCRMQAQRLSGCVAVNPAWMRALYERMHKPQREVRVMGWSSDFSGKAKQEIAIVRPSRKYGFLGADLHADAVRLRSAVGEIMEFVGLIHEGWLSCDKHGEPIAFQPCGEFIDLCPLKESDPAWLQRQDVRFILQCSNPLCQTSLGLRDFSTRSEAGRLMLDLMIKQMFPNLNMLNFVNCGDKEWPTPKAREVCPQVGVIALAAEALVGMVPNSFFKHHTLHSYGLGFTLALGMETTVNFGGYDAWARFLMTRREEAFKRLHKELLPCLLGHPGKA